MTPTDGAAAATGEWRGFSDAWHRGFREIFAIRLARGTPASVPARSHARTYVRWLGLAYMLPVTNVAAILLRAPSSSQRTSAVILLMLLGTVNAGMFAAAVLAWG